MACKVTIFFARSKILGGFLQNIFLQILFNKKISCTILIKEKFPYFCANFLFMGREQEIEHMHCGLVTHIDDRYVWVRINKPTTTDCSSCALSNVCKDERDGSHEIDVPVAITSSGDMPQVGDTVYLRREGMSNARIATLTIGVPLAAFTGGMFAAHTAGVSDLWSLAAATVMAAAAFAVVRSVGSSTKIWKIVR